VQHSTQLQTYKPPDSICSVNTEYCCTVTFSFFVFYTS
jgi:hypothetical protein